MNAIERVAAKLQRIPASERWLWAQQDVIAAAANGGRPTRGAWGRRADALIKAAGRIGMATIAAQAACGLLVLTIGLRQTKARNLQGREEHLFVGKGALSDRRLLTVLEGHQGGNARTVDEDDLSSFFTIQTVSLRSLVRAWWSVVCGLGQRLARVEPQAFPSSFCLTALISSGPKYIYLLAWFKKYLQAGGNPTVTFTAASAAVTFAAVAAGVRARYIPHGFLAYSIVFPDFAEVWCNNRWEAAHVRSRLPRARVLLRPDPVAYGRTRPLVAIVGVYSDESDLDRCRSFIRWARERGWPIVVRPHPFDRTDYWRRWDGVPGVTLSYERITFDDFLGKYRPSLLATWYSSTIMDALRHGIVPLSWSKGGSYVEDTVIPFDRLALRWPEQCQLVRRMFEDESLRREFVAETYADVTAYDDDVPCPVGLACNQ